jgi:hypothetical protein
MFDSDMRLQCRGKSGPTCWTIPQETCVGGLSVLRGLEKKGYLRSTEQRLRRTAGRMYRITPTGQCALAGAKRKVRELFGEMFEAGGGKL